MAPHAMNYARWKYLTILILLMCGIGATCVLYPRSGEFNPGVAQPKHRPAVADDQWREMIAIFAALVSAALLARIPPTRDRLAPAIALLRSPTPARRKIIAGIIFLCSGPVLYLLGWLGDRILFPCWHDEGFYRLQSTFLAHGLFSTPSHPLADFFDVPWVFPRPIRAPVYFPGTALLHVPAIWLHLPYFVTPLIIASTILTLLYLIVTELLDGVAGLLAVVMMISLAIFRWLALIEMSHPAGAMWGLLALWSWLSWRKSKHIGWVALAGLAAGWYGITRPLDALGVLTPLALAWLWDLGALPVRARLASVAIVIAMIAPFIALQLVFNHAITGKYLLPPLALYNRIYLNAASFGLQTYDPKFLPPTPPGQIRDLYYWGDQPYIRDFTTVHAAATQWLSTRLPFSFGVTMPTLLLLVLYAVSPVGLTNRRRLVFWSMFWGYMATSACFYLFPRHYLMAIAPAAIFSVLLGADVLARAFPVRQILPVFFPLSIFLLSLHRIVVNVQGEFVDNSYDNVMRWNYLIIPAKIQTPAIVLFTYDSEEVSALNEPVYNWDVVSPDDAPIIRAHNLGDRNIELFRYYAERQPQRLVWLFDRLNKELTPLGKVTDLAKQERAK